MECHYPVSRVPNPPRRILRLHQTNAFRAACLFVVMLSAWQRTTLAGAAPQVISMSPAPNATLTAAPSNVTVNFSQDMDPATVNAGTVRLQRAGSDGIIGTADDVAITPASVTLTTPTQAVLDLAGIGLFT